VSKSKAQQPNYTFFLDENLGGSKVCTSLRGAGLTVEMHATHFTRGTADEDWLPIVGQRKWVLLTQDKGIRHHKNEILALRKNNVRAFIVAAHGLRGEQIGPLILSVMQKMRRILSKTDPPFIAIINRGSVIELKNR